MPSGTFVFQPVERILYGRPAAEALRGEVERLNAQRVFLLASGTLNRTTDEVQAVRDALGARLVGVYDRTPPHSPQTNILEAAAEAREAGADLIATFGGGSATDAGKIVRLALQHDVRTTEGLVPFQVVTNADGSQSEPQYQGPLIPQISVPTTLSAGEFHIRAAGRDAATGTKPNYRNPLLVARVVIFDPAAARHAPLWVWLSTGIRAVDHAAEGVASQFSNPVSDASALQALRLLKEALPRTKADPSDLDARTQAQLAAWLSVVGRQGGVQMGASHALGHVLGARLEVPHGYTSCVILPAVLRFNQSVNAHRHRLISEALGHPDDDAADVVEALIAALGLPTRLSEVNVDRSQFAAIARQALHDPWLHTNPRPIASPEQILEILESAA